MKALDVVNRVRNSAGDTAAAQFTDSMLVDWINDAIREIAVNNNLLQKRGTITVNANQQSFPAPADILKLHTLRVNGEKLTVYTLEEFDKYIGDNTATSVGTPQCVYSWATTFNLYPIPDRQLTVTIDYTYDPVNIVWDNPGLWKTQDLGIPVGYHSRVVDYCLAQVAQQDDDLNKYSVKMNEFTAGTQRLDSQQKSEEDVYPGITYSVRDTGGYSSDWWDM